MTMVRLLTLLIMFALAVTNGAAVTAAMCQHPDALAHAAARQSSDDKIAAQARSEDTAGAAASKKGSLSDAAASVSGYILPPGSLSWPARALGSMDRPSLAATRLAGRSVLPLLEPPLA